MRIDIATAPVSWGVLMKDTPNVPPWNTVLEQIREAGYTGTELGPYGYLPQDKVALQAKLQGLGLKLLSAYVQINLVDPPAHADEYNETMQTTRFLASMGCEWVVLSDKLFANKNRAARAGRIRPEDGLSGNDWKNFVKNANDYGKMALNEYGLKAVFHPHVGAFIETGDEMDRLLNDTDSRWVNLCLDTAHCMYGGTDPVELCRRWKSRIHYLHLKECDQVALGKVREKQWDYFKGVEMGVFPELGKGSVNFAGLLDVLKEANFTGWAVVEQDVLPETGADPLASAKRNLAYLRQIGIA